MQTEITDINELADLSGQLNSMTLQLDDSTGGLGSIIKGAKDYDGIDITTAGNILRNNLKTIATDMKNISANIKSYIDGIYILDEDDFRPNEDAFSLGNSIDSIGDFFQTATPTPVSSPANHAKQEEVTSADYDVQTAAPTFKMQNITERDTEDVKLPTTKELDDKYRAVEMTADMTAPTSTNRYTNMQDVNIIPMTNDLNTTPIYGSQDSGLKNSLGNLQSKVEKITDL